MPLDFVSWDDKPQIKTFTQDRLLLKTIFFSSEYAVKPRYF